MKALGELKAVVDRIDKITGQYNAIDAARAIVNARVAAIRDVSVSVGGYGSPEVKESARYVVAQRMQEIEAEVRADAEHDRDQKLKALAAELERLRDTLSGLVGRATIEIGIQARALVAEAEGKTDV